MSKSSGSIPDIFEVLQAKRFALVFCTFSTSFLKEGPVRRPTLVHWFVLTLSCSSIMGSSKDE